jgi:hypothetical protein
VEVNHKVKDPMKEQHIDFSPFDKMVDKEEPVELHIVLDMVEKVMDKVKDVTNVYKLDLLVLMGQVSHLKLVRFAIVPNDQMNSVMNIELVVQHHKYPKKVDIVDQVRCNNLVHYLNMHHYRKQPVVMDQENLLTYYSFHIHKVTNHLNHIYHRMMMANVIVFDNYLDLVMKHTVNIDSDEGLIIVDNYHLHDHIYSYPPYYYRHHRHNFYYLVDYNQSILIV